MSVAVDFRNPGQVFGCLGLVQLVEMLHLGARIRAGFRSDPSRFDISVESAEVEIAEVVRWLIGCEAQLVLPDASYIPSVPKEFKALLGDVKYRVRPVGEPIAYGPQGKALKRLPVELLDAGERRVSVNYQGNAYALTACRNGVLWAPTGTDRAATFYMVSALLRLARQDGIDLAAPFSTGNYRAHAGAIGFRLDPLWRPSTRRAGYSFNATKTACAVNPLTELLSALGLTYARPESPSRLTMRYAIPMGSFAPSQLRAGVGGAALPCPMRRYEVRLEDLTGKGTFAIDSVRLTNPGVL